jgi:hypothetical protein
MAGMIDFTDDQITGHLKSKGYVDQSGKAINPQGIQSEMQTYGVSTDRLNKATGWGWIDPKSGGATQASTPAPSPAPAGYSNEQIANHLRSKGFVDGNGSVNDPHGVYREMQTYGVAPDRIDQALGLGQHTAANWIRENVTQPATDAKVQTQTPAPAPSPQQSMLNDWFNSYISKAPAPAAQWSVDPGRTTQGLMGGMLDSNSVDMRRAAARGLANANSRGMLNSSQGIQSSQNALIDHASDIAKTDAAIYAESGRFNADQQNQVAAADLNRRAQMYTAGQEIGLGDRKLAQDDRQFTTSATIERQKIAAQIQQFQQQFGLDESKFTEQQKQYFAGLKLEQDKLDQAARQHVAELAGRIDLAKMDADNRLALADVEAKYKNQINRETNISNAWGTMLSEVGKIQGNNDMDATAKASAIQNVINGFQSYAKTWNAMAGINIDALLSFGITMPTAPPPPPIDPWMRDGRYDSSGDGAADSGVGTNADGDAAGVGTGPM